MIGWQEIKISLEELELNIWQVNQQILCKGDALKLLRKIHIYIP